MKSYKCLVCGYVYGPEQGIPNENIASGTPFSGLPNDWLCPLCDAGKDEFIEL